jgi:hypothetical protein
LAFLFSAYETSRRLEVQPRAGGRRSCHVYRSLTTVAQTCTCENSDARDST